MALTLRHQARILAMQALYEWDIAGHDPYMALERHMQQRFAVRPDLDLPSEREDVEDLDTDDIEHADLPKRSERRMAERIGAFARDLIAAVLSHQTEIDAELTAAATARPLTQMARVEKAILRLAISEILFNNAVPARAAINEAVELAKAYGGEHSGRFVNGVLGTVFTHHTPPVPDETTYSESEERP